MSKSVAAAFVGFGYAAFLLYLAFVFAGGGHGWLWGFYLSIAGLTLIPFATITLVSRRRSAVLAALAIAAVFDLFLVVATSVEGFECLERSYRAVPLFVHSWIALWLLWQLALVFALQRENLFRIEPL